MKQIHNGNWTNKSPGGFLSFFPPSTWLEPPAKYSPVLNKKKVFTQSDHIYAFYFLFFFNFRMVKIGRQIKGISQGKPIK